MKSVLREKTTTTGNEMNPFGLVLFIAAGGAIVIKEIAIALALPTPILVLALVGWGWYAGSLAMKWGK